MNNPVVCVTSDRSACSVRKTKKFFSLSIRYFSLTVLFFFSFTLLFPSKHFSKNGAFFFIDSRTFAKQTQKCEGVLQLADDGMENRYGTFFVFFPWSLSVCNVEFCHHLHAHEVRIRDFSFSLPPTFLLPLSNSSIIAQIDISFLSLKPKKKKTRHHPDKPRAACRASGRAPFFFSFSCFAVTAARRSRTQVRTTPSLIHFIPPLPSI